MNIRLEQLKKIIEVYNSNKLHIYNFYTCYHLTIWDKPKHRKFIAEEYYEKCYSSDDKIGAVLFASFDPYEPKKLAKIRRKALRKFFFKVLTFQVRMP